MEDLVKQLVQENYLDADGYYSLIKHCNDNTFDLLRTEAVKTANKYFGKGIYIRGLIEIGNYCHNDCFYCGVRHSNTNIQRYRLSINEIHDCCISGYKNGIRTFVLQSGEDYHWTDEKLCEIITTIKSSCPDAAITLSLGERTKSSYRTLFNAGATRYLLRHEAADMALYNNIHPTWMSHSNRIECIENLIEIGYQTGIGMMIGVPGQTIDSLVEDLIFIQRIKPQMIGIGPFIPHKDTPMGNNSAGDIRLSLIILSIVRLIYPNALIPATTALSTLSTDGHKQAILSGANVIMPNLSPAYVRNKYAIYDNKKAFGVEAAENLLLLQQELNSFGYHIDYSRGDYKPLINNE